MANKMTKKETLVALMEKYATDEMLVAYAQHEIELLDKKRSQGNAKANEKVESGVALVYAELCKVERATATELIAQGGLNELANDTGIVTSQKVANYLNKLVAQGKATKVVEKKVTYFTAIVE